MKIQDIMTNPNLWNDTEVIVMREFTEEKQYTLCSDEQGFYLMDDSGIIIRDTSELGPDFDRLGISIVVK